MVVREHPAAKRLLRWYDRNARALPWRETRDPYALWVAEVMLQQTVVETVAGYYRRFLDRFPTVAKLAAAPLDDVMKMWEGLGYYKRAVNLHHAARVIVKKRGGTFPRGEDGWRELPGVGPYTAAALAAFVDGERTLAVDVLVRRVSFRFYGLPAFRTTARLDSEIRERGVELLTRDRPGDGVQALMDLATELCRPREPRCEQCPLRADCAAFAAGDTGRNLVKRRTVRKALAVAVGLWVRDGCVFLQRRAEQGLFAGLWELPGGKVEPGETPEEAVVREFREELGRTVRVSVALGPVRHAYTTFKVTLHPFVVVGSGPAPKGEGRLFVPVDEVERYAQPAANAKIWRAYFASIGDSDRMTR